MCHAHTSVHMSAHIFRKAYEELEYCFAGEVGRGREWIAGPKHNWPERHCCACGKAGRVAAARRRVLFNIHIPKTVRRLTEGLLMDWCAVQTRP